MKNLLLALAFVFGSINVANAQFNDLLRSVKGVVDAAANAQNPQKAPGPATAPAATSQSTATKPAPVTNGPCGAGEKLVFSCKLKGEPLNYCYADFGGARTLEMKTKINGKDTSVIAADLRDDGAKPPYANVQESASTIDGRDLFTTIYMTEKDNRTFAVTQCSGMRCGTLADQPWFSVFNGTKKVSSTACDEGSVTEQTFNYKYTNKGKIVNDGLYREQKTKLDFGPPNF